MIEKKQVQYGIALKKKSMATFDNGSISALVFVIEPIMRLFEYACFATSSGCMPKRFCLTYVTGVTIVTMGVIPSPVEHPQHLSAVFV